MCLIHEIADVPAQFVLALFAWAEKPECRRRIPSLQALQHVQRYKKSCNTFSMLQVFKGVPETFQFVHNVLHWKQQKNWMGEYWTPYLFTSNSQWKVWVLIPVWCENTYSNAVFCLFHGVYYCNTLITCTEMQYQKRCYVIIYSRAVTNRMKKEIQALNGG